MLDFRDLLQRSPGAPAGSDRAIRDPRAKGGPEASNPAWRANPAGGQTPDALTRLGRRCAILVLAMAPGEPRQQVRLGLRAAGYLRLDQVDTLDQALDHLRADPGSASRLLVLDTPSGEAPPLAGIRALQRELGELRELPVALIQQDGIPAETGDPLIRPIPWPGSDPATWLPLLDELAGL